MFFSGPLPEEFVPAAHGWEEERMPDPGGPGGAGRGEMVTYLRWAPPVRFPAALTVFRDRESGERRAVYVPLATSAHAAEETLSLSVAELLAEIG